MSEEDWLDREVFARRVGVEITLIEELITVGLIEVSGDRLPAHATVHVQRCVRIHRDLDVEVRTLPLVLQLLDRIERLERR